MGEEGGRWGHGFEESGFDLLGLTPTSLSSFLMPPDTRFSTAPIHEERRHKTKEYINLLLYLYI